MAASRVVAGAVAVRGLHRLQDGALPTARGGGGAIPCLGGNSKPQHKESVSKGNHVRRAT